MVERALRGWKGLSEQLCAVLRGVSEHARNQKQKSRVGSCLGGIRGGKSQTIHSSRPLLMLNAFLVWSLLDLPLLLPPSAHTVKGKTCP